MVARTRKTARMWSDEAPLEAARRILVPDDGPVFTIDPDEIFSNPGTLEVEIGAGRGDFIIEHAAANPARNFLAVERPGTRGHLLAMQCVQAGIDNLKVAAMDARPLVSLILPERSVSAYHIYFPDPWPKRAQGKHRLFGPSFVHGLARTLIAGGMTYVATDVGWWASEIFESLEECGFRRVAAKVPGAILTGFARKYLAQGKDIFSGAFEFIEQMDLQYRPDACLKANSAQ